MNEKRGLITLSSEIRSSKKPRATASADEVDARIAAAVGLPPYVLSPEERAYLPASIEEGAYLIARNHILTKWRKQPRQLLSLEEASKKILVHHGEVAAYAWKFLDHYSYINFGLCRGLDHDLLHAGSHKGTVIVIGAGLAGLAAGRQLRLRGFRVMVLEGRDRIGGRVYSEPLTMDGNKVVVELGGSIINGVEGNPLALLAAQLKLPLHKISNEVPLHFPDGSLVPQSLDRECEVMYNALLDRCGKIREALGPAGSLISLGKALGIAWKESKMSCTRKQKMLINWHLANLEFANASKLNSLSLVDWDQDDPYELPGDHVFLPGGNTQIINRLGNGLNIMLSQVVQKVRYSSSTVEVFTEDAIHRGDAVLVTVPLGVLKQKLIEFDPPLTLRKQTAIERLGYGALNKVIMWFPRCFWQEKGDMFGCVNRSEVQRGKYFLFYSYAGISGGAVLAALISGRAAEISEKKAEEVIIQDVLQVLSNIFNPCGIHGRSYHVPQPIKAYCTRWNQDRFSLGAYSSVAVGSRGSEDYDILAENIANRVFFAGEATSRKYPATMHGAFLTGLREAAHISAAFDP